MQDTNAREIGWKAVSKTGVIAAGGARAVAAGIEILSQGGNAADAAAATILALNVTDHGACSIGGEVPVLIYDAKKQEVKALCGQGRAPLSQKAIDWYMKNGIPAGDINTTPGHPNCIQPGKRPRITLTPTLVLKNGKPILAISVAGGDLQDQATLNLLLDFVEFDMLPEEAVTAPRFATAHHQDSFDPNPDRVKTFKQAGSLTISDSVSQNVMEELARRGHRLKASASPIANPVMLYVDQDSGMLYAAGDPAARRHAAGLGR